MPNLTFGKLPLWKRHILEVATWEIVTWEVALWKMPLGNTKHLLFSPTFVTKGIFLFFYSVQLFYNLVFLKIFESMLKMFLLFI